MAIPKLPCSQQDLYGAFNCGLNSLEEHLDDFTNFSPMYKPTWIADRRAQLNAAEELPDVAARRAEAELKRIELDTAGTAGLALWQTLKRYQTKYYKDAETRRVHLRQAGSAGYEKAQNGNWSEVVKLMRLGNQFIEKEGPAMIAADIMAADFPATFATAATSCKTLQAAYVKLQELAKGDMEAKQAADRNLYDILIEFFKDGQDIYKDSEAIRKKFVFEEVSKLVGGTGSTGLKGYVMNGENNAPVEGVEIKAEGHSYGMLTDETGIYHIKQIAAGTYIFNIVKEGYISQKKEVTLEAGITKTLNISLTLLQLVNN